MPKCGDCVHWEICNPIVSASEDSCTFYKDSSRFVELKSAEWIEDEDVYGDPIFRCSNCEARFVLEEGTPEDNEYYYCPTCGAKIQEQALKERENDTPEAAIIRLNQFRTDKDERDPAIDMAIRAIRLQFIERKPIHVDDDGADFYNCPQCYCGGQEKWMGHCYHCGQALDWKGEEK